MSKNPDHIVHAEESLRRFEEARSSLHAALQEVEAQIVIASNLRDTIRASLATSPGEGEGDSEAEAIAHLEEEIDESLDDPEAESPTVAPQTVEEAEDDFFNLDNIDF